MPSDKLFVRDPREVSFLRNEVEKLLTLADKSSRTIPIRQDDDFGFMTLQFLYKQIQHGESILLLIPRRDAGLVARTMIEGYYQLFWASQSPEERAKLWRSFSVIHDWRRIQAQLKEGIAVAAEDAQKTEAILKVFGDLHRTKKQQSSDPYHKNWRGGVSLADMADLVGRELYDGPYDELSDWEHWGLSGIGDSITRENNHVLVNSDSERIAGLSLLAAFQCLHQTLMVADMHLLLSITETIQEIGTNFVKTINSFYQG